MGLLPASLRGRLLVACIALTILSLVLGGAGLAMVHAIRQAADRRTETVNMAGIARAKILTMRLAAFQLVSTREGKQLAELRKGFEASLNTINDVSERFACDPAPVLASYEQALKHLETFDTRKASSVLYGIGQNAHDALLNSVEEAASIQVRVAESQANQAVRTGTIILAVASAATLLLLVLIWWMARRTVTDRLAALGGTVSAAAAGDLTAPVTVSGGDEVAALADGIRSMLAAQAAAVVAIRQQADALASESARINATAARLSAAATATAQRSDSATTDMSAVAESVSLASAAADELQSSIADIARTAEAATVASRDAGSRAGDVRASVARLGDIGGRVGAVAQQIAGIAGQINLLALNATIEAARAGEAGRGFAVVACEVKALSGRTTTATGDIAKAVAQVSTDVQAAVAAVEAVLTAVGSIANQQQSAAAAIEEQSATVSSIAEAMRSAVNRGTSASTQVGGVATSASATSKASEETSAAAAELTRLADRLRQAVSRFKT